jgi:hypothetical protein
MKQRKLTLPLDEIVWALESIELKLGELKTRCEYGSVGVDARRYFDEMNLAVKAYNELRENFLPEELRKMEEDFKVIGKRIVPSVLEDLFSFGKNDHDIPIKKVSKAHDILLTYRALIEVQIKSEQDMAYRRIINCLQEEGEEIK